MRFAVVSLSLLPLALAATSPTSTEALDYTGTDQIAYSQIATDDAQFSSILVSQGYKPQVVSYFIGLESNTAVAAAFDALYTQTAEYNYELTGSIATATGPSNAVVQGLLEQAAQVTVVPAEYRSILSSVINEELHLQTAAAAPTDLALSAGVAGVVAAVAGLAVGL